MKHYLSEERTSLNKNGPLIMPEIIKPDHRFPAKLYPLFVRVADKFPPEMREAMAPAIGKRWIVVFGGRDGGKSWNIARVLLVLGKLMPLRILCCRDIMKSLDESVHQLLKDQIVAMGFEQFYSWTDKSIKGINGTLFSYVGLRHNVKKVKSFEGYDIAWVEEAADTLQSSWLMLENTIRKPGSQIIVSFNPDLATDATYVKLIKNPPADALAIKMTWRDNPWASESLRIGREKLKREDPDEYDVVWEGNTRQAIAGSIYEKELRAARRDTRITRVPYDRRKPVSVYMDIGKRDLTTMWFVQKIGFFYHIIDYFQGSGLDVPECALILQNRGYVYSGIWLPHDARHDRFGMVKGTIEKQFKQALGFNKVKITKNMPIADGINAVRTIFPQCYFDEESTTDGMTALARYAFKVDPETKARSKEPDHTWSDASDAFRYFAVSVREGEDRPAVEYKPPQTFVDMGSERGTGWMGH